MDDQPLRQPVLGPLLKRLVVLNRRIIQDHEPERVVLMLGREGIERRDHLGTVDATLHRIEERLVGFGEKPEHVEAWSRRARYAQRLAHQLSSIRHGGGQRKAALIKVEHLHQPSSFRLL